MPGLNGQDRASSGQQDGVRDEDSAAKVCGNSNVLDNTSSGSHGGNISEGTIELELAVGDGLSTEGLKSSLMTRFEMIEDG